MTPVEDLLRKMSLREPSADLDRRVSASLQPGSERRLWKQVAFWSHIVTAAACLVIGVIIGQSQNETRTPPGTESFMDRGHASHRVLRLDSVVAPPSDEVPREALESLNSHTHFTEYRYRQCVACHQYTEPSATLIDIFGSE
jgi:hypothetical protein